MPPLAIERPPGPYLPPVAAKVPRPTASEISTSLVVAIAKTESSTQTHSKLKRKRLIALAIVVVTPVLVALVFHDSAFVERFTGKGYDTNPLPLHSFPEPEFVGAEYTLTTQSIAMSNGLPTNYWRTERDEVNFTTKIARATFDHAKASVIGGAIGTPQSTSPPTSVFVDEQSSFFPGDVPSDPWTRQRHDPGWSSIAVLSPHEVLMYQDVVDPALRSQKPTSVVHETRHDIPVTTYSYTFTFANLYESAPRLFDMVKAIDATAGADGAVSVSISFDEQWIVRYLDFNVDFHSVLKYKAEHDVETPYPYRYTMDVVSTTTDSPPNLAVPTNVIDAVDPTTTSPVAP